MSQHVLAPGQRGNVWGLSLSRWPRPRPISVPPPRCVSVVSLKQMAEGVQAGVGEGGSDLSYRVFLVFFLFFFQFSSRKTSWMEALSVLVSCGF